MLKPDGTEKKASMNFKTSIEYGGYNLEEIKNELKSMLSNSGFDWREYSIETLLCYDRPENTITHARKYLKYCICDVLYPDKQTNNNEREELNSSAAKCLSKYKENNGRCSLSSLYQLLIQHSEFYDLEYHNIFHVINESIGKIEMKYHSVKGVH